MYAVPAGGAGAAAADAVAGLVGAHASSPLLAMTATSSCWLSASA